jgi:FdhD protein
MSVLRYHAIKHHAGLVNQVSDALTMESPLKILINGEVFTITMQSPGNEKELIRGLLYTEDIYKSKTEEPTFIVAESNRFGNPTTIDVKIPTSELGDRYLNKRNLLSVASCGICGKTDLEIPIANKSESLNSSGKFSAKLIPDLFEIMNQRQGTFQQSGGSHASAAFTIQGKLLSLQEDIGRHNAVDKVIGELLQNQKLTDAKIIIVSGRISYEIVSKCFVAGIGMLAAVSAPSSLAVDFAKELGITLIAFCRNRHFTVYSHPEKVISDSIKHEVKI